MTLARSTATPTLAPGADDRSRLLPMAPGRLWVQDLGPAGDTAEPPLLCLHSLLVTGWDFRRIALPWAAGEGRPPRRTITPDLFGCGNSDRPPPADTAGYGFAWHAEILARMLDRLDIATIDVLGHGYGGSIAIHLAHRLSRTGRVRVRRLIAIAPHVLPVRAPIALPGPMPALRRTWRWVGFAPLVLRTVFRRADLRRFLRRSLANEARLVDEPLRHDVDVYWDRLCRTGGLEAVEAMLAQLDALDPLRNPNRAHPHRETRRDLYEAARSLTVPSMIVWGDQDTVAPTDQAERVAQLIPDAQLRIVEDCGHAPHREQPDALLRVLDGFDRRMLAG